MIKSYKQYIIESVSEKSNMDLILPKGSILFHSSVEPITLPLRVGSYDKVLWTAKDSGISQMYIPKSTSSTYTNTNTYVHPLYDKTLRSIQKQLGIDYDYSDVEWNGTAPRSYKMPAIFSEVNNEYYKNRDAYYALDKEVKQLESDNADREIIYGKKKELKELGDTVFNSTSLERKYNDIVNDIIIKKFGYKPTNSYDNANNYQWKFKTKFNDGMYELKHSDYKVVGKLYILTLKRDFKFYNYAFGKEGDLTDLEYHKVDMFRNAEENGYDGIIINDFAQSDVHGNFGHISYGLFKDAIKDLSVEYIDATHPSDEWTEKMYKKNDYRSEEYIRYQEKPEN